MGGEFRISSIAFDLHGGFVFFPFQSSAKLFERVHWGGEFSYMDRGEETGHLHEDNT